MIVAEDIAIRHQARGGAVELLREVSFRCTPCSLTVLSGPSGSGKSSLLAVVAGLMLPAAGRVALFGQDLAVLSERQLTALRRKDVALIFQSYNLFPHLTVERNITLALTLVKKQSRDAALAKAAEVLAMVGLTDKRTAYPEQLSGGQQQRVAIARSLALSPQVMLFDEVTSALDTVVAAAILDLMAELRRDLGLTTMFISHDLKTVRAICDDVMVLYAGRMAEKIPASAIMAPHHHPYTQLLFASVPELRRGWLEDSTAAASEAKVDIVAMQASTGCAFFPRCPQRIAGTCDRMSQPVRQVSADSIIACHRALSEL